MSRRKHNNAKTVIILSILALAAIGFLDIWNSHFGRQARQTTNKTLKVIKKVIDEEK